VVCLSNFFSILIAGLIYITFSDQYAAADQGVIPKLEAM